MTSSSTRERKLTPPEITDRTPVLLALLDDQDSIRLRVRASRDELREWRVEARNLAIQIDQVRQEIRSGIVTENAQQGLPFAEPPRVEIEGPTAEELQAELADSRAPEMCIDCGEAMQHCDLDGSRQWVCPKCDSPKILERAGISGTTDEPDPETDPPAPDPYWGFNQNYPAPKDHAALHDMLMDVLTEAELSLLNWGDVKTWHKSSGQFDAVAHWTRVENAHKSHANRKPTPGITIPARFSMPLALAQALATSAPKKKAKATRKKRVKS